MPNGQIRLQTWLHSVVNGQHSWSVDTAYAAPSISVDYTKGVDGRVYATLQDINNDGLIDWLTAYTENNNFQSEVWLNTGQGWQEISDVEYQLPRALFNYDLGVQGVSEYNLIDINGDSRADLVKAYSMNGESHFDTWINTCLLYTSPSPRDRG